MNDFQLITPAKTVCFSGHRPERLPKDTGSLEYALSIEIGGAIERGKDTFINGFMAGFDLIAALQVLKWKERRPDIRLVTIIPFSENYYAREKCWTREWIKMAESVRAQSSAIVTIAGCYRRGIYYERNHAMADPSSELICYYDGGGGGTLHTVKYAESKGLFVRNLAAGVRNDYNE